jgi:hypothetical protein
MMTYKGASYEPQACYTGHSISWTAGDVIALPSTYAAGNTQCLQGVSSPSHLQVRHRQRQCHLAQGLRTEMEKPQGRYEQAGLENLRVTAHRICLCRKAIYSLVLSSAPLRSRHAVIQRGYDAENAAGAMILQSRR